MKVGLLTHLHVILEPTVGGCRRQQQMHAIPHQVEGVHVEPEGRCNAAEIVEVLNWVHCSSTSKLGARQQLLGT